MLKATLTLPRNPDRSGAILAIGAVLYGLLCSGAILAISAVCYGLLCLPAIGQRDYPPLDPFWTAMPFLWPFPIVLSGVFDSGVFASRRHHLMWYAVATALVDAATMTTIVERHVSLADVLFGTLFLFGPVHLFVMAVLELVTQSVLRLFRKLVADDPALEGRGAAAVPRTPLRLWCLCAAIAALTIGFPFVFAHFAREWTCHRGRLRAELDWSNQGAVVYSCRYPNELDGEGFQVEREFDVRTGLKLRMKSADWGFKDAYNRRISELVESQGVPAWSMKPYLVPDAEMLRLLDAGDFRKVDQFPCAVGKNSHLELRKTFGYKGTEETHRNEHLEIVTPHGSIGLGRAERPIYVASFDKYPHRFFVRIDRRWLGVFHEDGQCLGSVSRD